MRVTLKQKTLEIINKILIESAIPGSTNEIRKVINSHYKNLVIHITGNANIDQESIKALKKVIQEDGFFKSFQVYVNGKEIKISLLSDEIKENNSSRKTVITHDEITNFLILLNSPITWEQFMEVI